jgi:magnesium-protoporphyrin O-methyltransferase
MPTATYTNRRGELETYFDRTAMEAWKKLTSDAPVGRIRATVRAGREKMRGQLMSWLPADLTGLRLLDAGCGTGALAMEAAARGAHVTAIDLSENLVAIAREQAELKQLRGHIDFRVGDMLDPALGEFDHIACMDSLIHYECSDIVNALSQLTRRCSTSVVFTFAPRTRMLATMHKVGKFFPRSDRAPAIEPVSQKQLHEEIIAAASLSDWQTWRSNRISSGFYKSQAQELNRK